MKKTYLGEATFRCPNGHETNRFNLPASQRRTRCHVYGCLEWACVDGLAGIPLEPGVTIGTGTHHLTFDGRAMGPMRLVNP